MRLFAGGISTETNTFAEAPTTLANFYVQPGAGDVVNPGLDLRRWWDAAAREDGHELVLGIMAWAAPGGTTIREAYETLRDRLLLDLEASGHVDVVLLNLHGAMVADGYDDCEGDLIERVRDVVGPDTTIGVLLDLHCHVSKQTIAQADIVVAYKEYPHIDCSERASELYRLCVAAQRGEISPVMALADCRMVGFYPTGRQPLRNFVDSLKNAEGKDAILSLSFLHGFPYGDVPQLGAKMLAVLDGDKIEAAKVAENFVRQLQAMRHEIGFENISVTLDRAIALLRDADGRPIVLADQSDNVGGGAPGDATYVAEALIGAGLHDFALAILYDPDVVQQAILAGTGAEISVKLGGKRGRHSGTPLDLDVTVGKILRDYKHAFPQESGDVAFDPAGDVVRLQCDRMDFVVSSERCQCLSYSIFSDLGIDPNEKKVLVAKSVNHFTRSFSEIAKQIIYVSAQGAVPTDPRIIGYRRFDPSIFYPWKE